VLKTTERRKVKECVVFVLNNAAVAKNQKQYQTVPPTVAI